MKSHLRWSKCSGSTKAKINRIIADGGRAVRRALSADKRRNLRELKEGGFDAW